MQPSLGHAGAATLAPALDARECADHAEGDSEASALDKIGVPRIASEVARIGK